VNLVELTLQQVAHQLGVRHQPWALVGGFAVSIRAEPRFTADVDVAVAVPDDTAAEHLVRDLMSTGYQVLASIEQDETARLATVRLGLPTHEGVVLDLLFASSGIEAEIVAAAERIEVLAVARTAADLIVGRGYGRGRDLRKALDEVLG
jgi:hypothetical protein